MEDYFVIILTLIIAVVGILNRKKKKNAPKLSVVEGAEQSSDFWDVIMNQQEEEFVEEPVDEYIEPEPVVERYKQAVEKPKYFFTAANEGKSNIPDATKAKPIRKRKVMIEGEEFSLKKAVIYSEIMKRKYS